MNAKTPKQPVVEFYATSSQLAQAFRHAAKQNKALGRLAKIQELRHAATAHEAGKRGREFEMVVLSHAEDSPLALLDPRAEAVVSEAFHLLFTGPGTHPNQVAQWIRSTNIRSENRLHVVKVQNMEARRCPSYSGESAPLSGRIEARAASSTRTSWAIGFSSGARSTGCCTSRKLDPCSKGPA